MVVGDGGGGAGKVWLYFSFYFDQGCSLSQAFGKLVAAWAFMPPRVSNLNHYQTNLVINQNYFETWLFVFLK